MKKTTIRTVFIAAYRIASRKSQSILGEIKTIDFISAKAASFTIEIRPTTAFKFGNSREILRPKVFKTAIVCGFSVLS